MSDTKQVEELRRDLILSEAARSELATENARLRRDLSVAQSSVRFYQEREENFSRVLKVADGGTYRADWASAIHRVVRERDELRAQVDSAKA